MSDVFLGYDPAGLRPVAVKVLGEHLAGQLRFIDRFYREARMSRALDHSNLIRGQAHGYDREARRHFLILEYVDGSNALTLLDQHGPLPLALVARIGIEIARALDYLHGNDFVHRDVKPENVIVTPDGSAKLGDLGLAKRMTGSADLTAGDEGVGTPHYMPYEQAVNGVLVDGRSDLFALGATLYHLLTGQVPFPGQTHEEIVREKARGAFRPVRVLRPDVPVDLDRILSRTLSRDPRSRFQSAAEFLSTLAATGLDRGPMALPGVSNESPPRVGQQPAARTHADLVATPGNHHVSVNAAGGSGRTRWLLGLASVVAAVVGFGGTWAVFQHRFAPTGTPDPLPDQLTPGATSSAGTTGGDYNKPTGPATGG